MEQVSGVEWFEEVEEYRSRVRGVDGWRHDFKLFGGERCADLVALYLAGRQEKGFPLTAGFLLRDVSFVCKDKFLDLVKRYRGLLGLDRCFFSVEDYIGFYGGVLDGFGYGELCSVFGVGSSTVYEASRELCVLHGVEGFDGLDDVVLSPESFGFVDGGAGVEGFAEFLVSVDFGEAEFFWRPGVWAAAAFLVSSKVI